ncbi:MAG: endonuclease/exonuclease/phosphatase family protein [Candidatus Eisenbacteria bacterium]
MMDRVEILVRRVRHAFSRSRWSGRFAGQESAALQHERPGIVLIQVDGLGETVLREALERGHLPFLSRLIQREGHQVLSLYSGLPSSTPGFQAELFFGERSAVPAFCYRDPELHRTLSLNDPAAAAAIEARLKAEGSGLLRGGSAWSNIFSGGAAEPHLCASTAEVRTARDVLSPRRWVALSLWHVWSFFRAFGTFLLVSILAAVDLFRGRFSFREFLRELRLVPLRVLVSVVMREIVVAGATIDLHRGLPVVQLNLLGYDEHAHRRGPKSRFALWSLRGIDKAIHRVWHAMRASRARDYQIWVYSDHGQERVRSFAAVHHESVPHAVARVYDELTRTFHEETDGRPETILDPSRPSTIERSRWLGSKMLEKRLREAAPEPSSRGATRVTSRFGDIIVTHQGPTGAIYLPRQHSPEFLNRMGERLVRDGNIPTAVRRTEDGAGLAWSARGSHRLPQQAGALLGEDHPHLREVSQDLVGLAHHPGAGDILIFGWDREEPLSLQEERGSHGGPGPNETSAFVLVPPEAHAFAALPRVLRPSSLRSALLRVMGRWPGEGAEESAPEYRPPRLTRRGLAPSTSLRIMTYNVHGCRGTDGIYAPQRIARVIARERPDIICLQELDQERARSGGVDQVHQIAQRLQREYLFHVVSQLDDGNFGNAILSSLPIRLHRAGALPSAARAKNVFNLWPRGVLWAVVDVEGHPVHVLNTHLSILPAERHLQVEALLGPEWLRSSECHGAVVLAGDFNAGASSRTMTRLQEAITNAVPERLDGRALRTWTGSVPLRRLDHILISSSLAMTGVRAPRTAVSRVASDHVPLVVDVTVTFTDLPRVRAELTPARQSS